jgi:Arc/MetJ-type ribon-helix-helix transcriptional regulator
MKHRVTITVDEETILRIREGIRSGKFRNRSHALEYALQKLLEGEHVQSS